MENQPDFKKIILGLAVAILILVVVVFVGYRYAQQYGAKLSLPSGQTYLGEEGTDQEDFNNPPTAPKMFTVSPDTPWEEYRGAIYPYSFKYPETLTLNIFPDDPNDSVAIVWGNILPQRNVLLNVENIPNRDPQYVGKIEEYARNWWQFFSGLTGLKSIEKFTNTAGMTGYKAFYTNQAGESVNTDVFFGIPGDPNRVLHIANGILDPEVFDRIVDSLDYQTATDSAE